MISPLARIDKAIDQRQRFNNILAFRIPGDVDTESRPARILVIDDDINIIKLIILHLNKNGYYCMGETNPKKGLELAFEKNMDLILLDIKMPDLNGYEVFQKIRTEEIPIPIIFVTALTDFSTKTTILQLGLSDKYIDYIIKPFQPDDLLAKIKTNLQRFYTTKGKKQ